MPREVYTRCPNHYADECRDMPCKDRRERPEALPFAPYWKNGCGHAASEFVGTVLEDGKPIDIYKFTDRNGIVVTCSRFGDKEEEYRSGPYGWEEV